MAFQPSMFLYGARPDAPHWQADCSRALLAAAAAASLQGASMSNHLDSNNLSNCNAGLFTTTTTNNNNNNNNTAPTITSTQHHSLIDTFDRQRPLTEALMHMQQQHHQQQQQHLTQHRHARAESDDDDQLSTASDQDHHFHSDSSEPLHAQQADENDRRTGSGPLRDVEQETALNLSLRASRQVSQRQDTDDLDRIRNFIEQFKSRRGTLGLTQKQAAQCFRAYTNDRYAFSDNFVGHFEGFQFRPQTAMTIADSLAEWLEFAERETRAGRQLSFMPGRVKETRKRKYEVIRIRDSAKRVLVEAFEKNKSPSTSELEQLSKKTNIPSRNIEIFFKNRRTSRQYHQ